MHPFGVIGGMTPLFILPSFQRQLSLMDFITLETDTGNHLPFGKFILYGNSARTRLGCCR